MLSNCVCFCSSWFVSLQQIFGYQPNVDYPAYDKIPSGLTFRCADRQPGYYADIETRCQVWHWCLPTGYMFSFLCPNGTVFNQVSIVHEMGLAFGAKKPTKSVLSVILTLWFCSLRISLPTYRRTVFAIGGQTSTAPSRKRCTASTTICTGTWKAI